MSDVYKKYDGRNFKVEYLADLDDENRFFEDVWFTQGNTEFCVSASDIDDFCDWWKKECCAHEKGVNDEVS